MIGTEKNANVADDDEKVHVNVDSETPTTGEHAGAPKQVWFAEEGALNNEVTMLRCQHHLPEEDKGKAIGMSDEYIVLGGMTIWPCVNCSKRIRENIETSILVEGARIMLRNEPEFTTELIKRMRDENEAAATTEN